MKCIICEKNTKNSRGLSIHIKTIHKIDKKEYYDSFLKKCDENKCLICGKETRFLNINKGYNKYCTVKCAGKDKNRTKNIASSKKEWHSKKENKEHMKELAYKQWNIKNSKIRKSLQSDEFRKKCSERNKKLFKDENYVKKRNQSLSKSWNDERKVNHSEFMTKYWAKNKERKSKLIIEMKEGKAAYMNMFIKNPSKPQVELFHLCQKLLPYPIMNCPCGRYSIDIAIPILNLAIEYDGSYWHQDEEYDQKRQKEIEEDGWIFIRYCNYIPTEKEFLNHILKNWVI